MPSSLSVLVCVDMYACACVHVCVFVCVWEAGSIRFTKQEFITVAFARWHVVALLSLTLSSHAHH